MDLIKLNELIDLNNLMNPINLIYLINVILSFCEMIIIFTWAMCIFIGSHLLFAQKTFFDEGAPN